MNRIMAKALGFLICKSGTTAVEFAIICFPIVLLALGAIEFGRAFNMRNDIAYAADIGARTMLMDSTIAPSDVEKVVRDALAGRASGDLGVTVGIDSASEPAYRTLTVDDALDLLIPTLPGAAIRLTVERRVPL